MSDTFECNGCGETHPELKPHPRLARRYVGHCETCCEDASEVFRHEDLYSGRIVRECWNCGEAAYERQQTRGY